MTKYDKTIELIFILALVILGIYYIYSASSTQMLGEDEASYYALAKEFMELQYKANSYVIVPLLSLFYVPFFYLFGSSMGLAKTIIAIFGFMTIITIYIFCKKIDRSSIFGINVFGLASIAIILTISYFTHFMMISYTEIPIAFFSILFLYLLLDFNSIKKSILVGIVMAMAIYLKSTALLMPAVLLFFFLIKYYIRKDRDSFEKLKLSVISCIIFSLILLPFVLRNVILFNYPFVEGLNSFFPNPFQPSWGTTEIVRALSININPYDIFGFAALFLCFFGLVYFIETREGKMMLTVFTFLLFIIAFSVRNLLGAGIGDPRYFSFVFPQIAIIGGYYMSKVVTWKKYFMIIIIALFVFSLATSISVASSTSQSQRYSNDYVDALKWVKQNTKQDDIIFTAYGGSLMYYGERTNVWSSMNEFPEVMTTTNSNHIYDILKKYNISYILVWRGIIAQHYIIPESNINGAFTYNFLTQVDNDKEHFSLVFSNQENYIYKLL